MKNTSYSILLAAITALGSLGCAADTLESESLLRVEYQEEFGQLVIVGRSNWDGLADIWVDEGTELVNYGPLELEGSSQAIATRFDPSWTVSIRERVTEEERAVLFMSDAERADPDEIEDGDVDKFPGLCWYENFTTRTHSCRNRVCYVPNSAYPYRIQSNCTPLTRSRR